MNETLNTQPIPTESLEVSVSTKGTVTATLKLRWPSEGCEEGLGEAIKAARNTFQTLAEQFPTFALTETLEVNG